MVRLPRLNLFAGFGVPLRFLVVGSLYAYLSKKCSHPHILQLRGAIHNSHNHSPSNVSEFGQFIGGMLAYGALVHFIVAALVVGKRGYGLIGKNTQSGEVPAWY
jgi:hypothetical protein